MSFRSRNIDPPSGRDRLKIASWSGRQWSRQTLHSSGWRRTCCCTKSKIPRQRRAAWNPNRERSNASFNDCRQTKYMQLRCPTPPNRLKVYSGSVAPLNRPLGYSGSLAPLSQPLARLQGVASPSSHLTFRRMRANEPWKMSPTSFSLLSDTSTMQPRPLDGSARQAGERKLCYNRKETQQSGPCSASQ